MTRRRLVVLLVTVLAASCGSADPCVNDVLARVPSPTGSHQAVVFQRECGATTGFSTQVSIVRRDEVGGGQPSFWTAAEQGIVLIIDDDHGAAPQGSGGGPKVDVAWDGERQVVLTYHPRARVFRAVERLEDIRIEHRRAE